MRREGLTNRRANQQESQGRDSIFERIRQRTEQLHNSVTAAANIRNSLLLRDNASSNTSNQDDLGRLTQRLQESTLSDSRNGHGYNNNAAAIFDFNLNQIISESLDSHFSLSQSAFSTENLKHEVIEEWHSDIEAIDREDTISKLFYKQIYQNYGQLGLVMAIRVKKIRKLDQMLNYSRDHFDFIKNLSFYIYRNLVMPFKIFRNANDDRSSLDIQTNSQKDVFLFSPLSQIQESKLNTSRMNYQLLQALPRACELNKYLKRSNQTNSNGSYLKLEPKHAFVLRLILEVKAQQYLVSNPSRIQKYEKIYMPLMKKLYKKLFDKDFDKLLEFINKMYKEIKKDMIGLQNKEMIRNFRKFYKIYVIKISSRDHLADIKHEIRENKMLTMGHTSQSFYL